ncbi:hypothetical protein J6590_089164, partial [Homalodisca vitripennis]
MHLQPYDLPAVSHRLGAWRLDTVGLRRIIDSLRYTTTCIANSCNPAICQLRVIDWEHGVWTPWASEGLLT